MTSIKYRINGALFRFRGTALAVAIRAEVLRSNGIEVIQKKRKVT